MRFSSFSPRSATSASLQGLGDVDCERVILGILTQIYFNDLKHDNGIDRKSINTAANFLRVYVSSDLYRNSTETFPTPTALLKLIQGYMIARIGRSDLQDITEPTTALLRGWAVANFFGGPPWPTSTGDQYLAAMLRCRSYSPRTREQTRQAEERATEDLVTALRIEEETRTTSSEPSSVELAHRAAEVAALVLESAQIAAAPVEEPPAAPSRSNWANLSPEIRDRVRTVIESNRSQIVDPNATTPLPISLPTPPVDDTKKSTSYLPFLAGTAIIAIFIFTGKR